MLLALQDLGTNDLVLHRPAIRPLTRPIAIRADHRMPAKRTDQDHRRIRSMGRQRGEQQMDSEATLSH